MFTSEFCGAFLGVFFVCSSKFLSGDGGGRIGQSDCLLRSPSFLRIISVDIPADLFEEKTSLLILLTARRWFPKRNFFLFPFLWCDAWKRMQEDPRFRDVPQKRLGITFMRWEFGILPATAFFCTWLSLIFPQIQCIYSLKSPAWKKITRQMWKPSPNFFYQHQV